MFIDVKNKYYNIFYKYTFKYKYDSIDYHTVGGFNNFKNNTIINLNKMHTLKKLVIYKYNGAYISDSKKTIRVYHICG